MAFENNRSMQGTVIFVLINPKTSKSPHDCIHINLRKICCSAIGLDEKWLAFNPHSGYNDFTEGVGLYKLSSH
jgi:hypothetical protein